MPLQGIQPGLHRHAGQPLIVGEDQDAQLLGVVFEDATEVGMAPDAGEEKPLGVGEVSDLFVGEKLWT